MPFVAAILGGLLVFLGEGLTRWLIALGASFVVFKGVEIMMSEITSKTQGLWSDIPSHILQILAIGGVNQALSIAISGVTFHITFNFVGKKILSFRGS